MKIAAFPENISDHFSNILEEEKDFTGEKQIDNGFIIKRNKDKATIAYDDGKKIYAVKLSKINGDWQIIGHPSVWSDIRQLLNH